MELGPPYYNLLIRGALYSLMIGNAWDGLLVETTIFVPHCSIALHLSPLE